MTYTQQEIEFLTSDEFQKAIKPYWKPKVGDWYANKIKTIRIITPDDEYCVGHYIGLDRNDYEYWLPTEHDLWVILEEKLGFNNWFDVECCFMDYCDKPDNLKETELLTLAEYALKLLKRKQ